MPSEGDGRAIEDDVADALVTALDELERDQVTAFLLKQFAASKAGTDLPAGLVPEAASALADLDIGFDCRVDGRVLGDAVEAVVASRGEQSETGAHYTPDYVVEYINEETIDVQLQDALAPYTTADDAEDVSVLADHVPEGTKQAALAAIDDMCVLDPAMGSGHFLVDALARIADVRRQVDDVTPLWRHRQRTAQRNLYGVDINGLAVEMTKLRVRLLILEAIPTTAGGYPAIGGDSL